MLHQDFLVKIFIAALISFASSDASAQTSVLDRLGATNLGNSLTQTSVIATAGSMGFTATGSSQTTTVLSNGTLTVTVMVFPESNAYNAHGAANLDGITIGVQDKFWKLSRGKQWTVLRHELWHVWLVKNFPEFAKNCRQCAHAYIMGKTAADVCAEANAVAWHRLRYFPILVPRPMETRQRVARTRLHCRCC